MHWCSRHLFSVCHTHHAKNAHTLMQARLCNGAASSAISNYRENLETSFWSTANIIHSVKPWWCFSWTKLQCRACWLSNQYIYIYVHVSICIYVYLYSYLDILCRCIYIHVSVYIYYHFTYTFSHAHTEAHTHKHTCTISTQEEWRQPGIGAWLRGAEERLC